MSQPCPQGKVWMTKSNEGHVPMEGCFEPTQPTTIVPPASGTIATLPPGIATQTNETRLPNRNNNAFASSGFLSPNLGVYTTPVYLNSPFSGLNSIRPSLFDRRNTLLDALNRKLNSSSVYTIPNFSIFDAINSKRLPDVYAYVQKRKDLNSYNNIGNTPLIQALTNDDDEISTILIMNGANVNSKNDNDFTPLMAAASNDNELMVSLLLKKGANPSAKTLKGLTARDFTSDSYIKTLLSTAAAKKSRKKNKKGSKECPEGKVRDRKTGRCRNKKK